MSGRQIAKCFTDNDRLVAEYEIMEDGDVKEIYLDSLFRDAFRQAYDCGVRFSIASPHSKYNTVKDATPAGKIKSLFDLYEGEYKYRCEWP